MQIACGTSLQAALVLGAKIATGEIESGIAGGSDTVSDSPVVLGPKMQKRMIALSRARTAREKFAAFKSFNFGEITPVAPSTQEPRTGLSMGEHCELMAKQWGIAREAQDEVALRSHLNAARAYDEGFHDDLLVPCAGLLKDNNVRPDTSLEKMVTMKPAFDRKSGKGTLTAANSTPLTDGASSVLLASEEWARERGLPVLAWLTMGAVSANDFAHGDGLLMAPTIAVSNLMARSGLTFEDIDLFELHEAFAAQVLCTLKAWEDPQYNRDVLGRETRWGPFRWKKSTFTAPLAYGHPFAATGARILGMTAKMLNTLDKSRVAFGMHSRWHGRRGDCGKGSISACQVELGRDRLHSIRREMKFPTDNMSCPALSRGWPWTGNISMSNVKETIIMQFATVLKGGLLAGFMAMAMSGSALAVTLNLHNGGDPARSIRIRFRATGKTVRSVIISRA